MSGNEQKRDLAVSEAGRMGGKECARKHGPTFYQEIGKRGGEATRDRHGSAFYSEQGRKGGSETARRHGSDHFERIGKMGGKRVRALIEKGKSLEGSPSEG